MNLRKMSLLGLFAIAFTSVLLFVNATSSTSTTALGKPNFLQCPNKIRIETTTQGFMDLGWTGIGHNITLGQGNATNYAVTCPNAQGGNCGTCQISGPIADNRGTKNFQRCTGDTSITCSADTDCSSKNLGTCEFYLGGATPVRNGGVYFCVENILEKNHLGQMDISTVSGQFSKFGVKSILHNSETENVPCPVCQSSGAKFVCSGGKRAGLECQPHSAFPDNEVTSLDCPPSNPVYTSMKMDLAPIGTKFEAYNGKNTQTAGWVSWTLTDSSPNCNDTTVVGEKCFSGACSNDASKGCMTNSDCGTGNTCVGGRSTRSRPTACLGTNENPNNRSCVLEPDQMHGKCEFGPFIEKKIKKADGTYITVSENQSCYAHYDPFNSSSHFEEGAKGYTISTFALANSLYGAKAKITFGSLFAAPEVSGGAFNSILGLPGPSRISQKGEVTLSFPHSCPVTMPTTCEAQVPTLVMDPLKGKLSFKMTGKALSGTNSDIYGNMTSTANQLSLCVYDSNGLIFGKSIPGGTGWTQDSKKSQFKMDTLNEGKWKAMLSSSGTALSSAKFFDMPKSRSGLKVMVKGASNRCWSGTTLN